MILTSKFGAPIADEAWSSRKHMEHGSTPTFHCGQLEDESRDSGGGSSTGEGYRRSGEDVKGAGYLHLSKPCFDSVLIFEIQ